MASIPDDIYQQLVDEFGADADDVAQRALLSELTRHRIAKALARGIDPALAVADALGRDPGFIERSDRLAEERQRPDILEERLKRWG
jgi:hypothetical protein